MSPLIKCRIRVANMGRSVKVTRNKGGAGRASDGRVNLACSLKIRSCEYAIKGRGIFFHDRKTLFKFMWIV